MLKSTYRLPAGPRCAKGISYLALKGTGGKPPPGKAVASHTHSKVAYGDVITA